MANTPGDFLIRRNASDNSTQLTTSTSDLAWDTEVASSGSSITYSGGTFTLASGKYLIMWNEQFHTDDTTNPDRFEVQGRLRIAGTTEMFGAGSGFIRKASGDQDCIVHGASIVDIASDSTSLVTRFWRTDNSTGGTCDRVTGIGGVQILALDDTWDYGRYSLSSTAVVQTSLTTVAFDTNDEQDTGFSNSSGAITITDAGRYLVTVSVTIDTGNTGIRASASGELRLNGTAVGGGNMWIYIRDSDACQRQTFTYAGIIEVAASDVLTFAAKEEEGTTLTMQTGSSIEILELPSDAETIIVEATSGDMNTSTETEFAWDTNPQISTDTFTHTATSSLIEVDAADDYIFFWNLWADDSGVARSKSRLRISVNDTGLTYGASAKYFRYGAASLDGSVSHGAIAQGLSSGDDISLETLQMSETGTVTTDNGAMSGVSFDSLFGAGEAAGIAASKRSIQT